MFLKIINSTFLLEMSLFLISISSWVSSIKLYFSRNLTIYLSVQTY